MSAYTKEDLRKSVEELGVKRGDTLYVSSSLFQLGMMAGIKSSDELCNEVLHCLIQIVGEEGTIVVPTFTTSLGRNGKSFILEETPAETGIFSEFIRTHPASVRSMHPLHSVAAIGARAKEICYKTPPNSYSIDSPSFRLYAMNAMAVMLGAERPLSGWVHLLEALNGLPYIYNKVLNIEVYKTGQRINREFYAPVHYLDFNISYDIIQAELAIAETGVIKFSPLGNGRISGVTGQDYFHVGNKILSYDPYIFLKCRPKFRDGEIPFDGITD